MPVIEYILKGDAKGAVGAFSGTAKAAGIATTAFTLFTAASVKGAQGVFKLQQAAVNLRNELGDLAGQTAFSVETLSGLRVAASASNESLDTLAGGLRKFAKNMADTRDGTGEAKDAFAALGVEVANADGSLRDADEVFRETIALLQQETNDTEKAALATDLFGRSGEKLAQVLGTIPLEEFNERARIFGTDVGPKAVKAAQGWQSAMADFGLVTDSVKATVGDFFGPSILVGIDGVTNAFALFRIASDELSKAFFDLEFAGLRVDSAIENFSDDAAAIQKAWESALTSILPEFEEWDGVIGRIAQRFEQLKTTGAVEATEDLRSEYEKLIDVAMTMEDDFVGPLVDHFFTAAQAARDLAAAMREEAEAAAVVNEFIREELEFFADLEEMKQEAAEAAAERAQDARDQSAETTAALLEDAKAITQALVDQTRAIGAAYQQMGSNISSAITNTLGTLEAMGLEGSAAYKALFVIQKAAAIAGVTVDTARAVMGALAAAPGPIGIALGATMAIAGAAQIANIVATSIGSSGGISSPSGGGSAAVDRADTLKEQAIAGAPGGGGGGGGIPWEAPGGGSNRDRFVVMQFRHEIYDVTVPDSVRIPGSALSRVQKNGARVGQRGVSGRPRKLLTT